MSEKLKIVLGYILVCALWGSTWLVIQLGLSSLTPMISAGARFIVAAVAIFSIMLIRGEKLQTDKLSLILAFMMTFFSFLIPFGLVYWGEQYVDSGLASVLFGVYPFVVALLSMIYAKSEKIDMIKLLGLIIGFIGIIVIFSQQMDFSKSYFKGMIAVVLSAVMQAGIFMLIKVKGTHLHPLSMNFLPMGISGLFFLVLGYFFEDHSILKFDFNAIFSVLYLGLLGSVATFTTYYWLIKRISGLLLSLVAFITPIVALILGAVLHAERLSLVQIIGSIIVLVGLLTANATGILEKFKPKVAGK